VWDLASGAPGGEPLRGHDESVTSVTVGMLEGRPVIVSGGEDGTVRVWDLASGAPGGEPLRGHDQSVTSVTVGMLEGRPVIVSGGIDRTVRVWDFRDGELAAIHSGNEISALTCGATGTLVVGGTRGLMAIHVEPQ